MRNNKNDKANICHPSTTPLSVYEEISSEIRETCFKPMLSIGKREDERETGDESR